MQITLIRHAEVDISKNSLAYAFELKKWLNRYNSAEIKKDLLHRDEISKIFEESQQIVCSELKRSVDSILLYKESIDIKNRLFNEADLPYANWGLIRLPLIGWAYIFRFMWLFGYKQNGESLKEAKERSKKATDILVNLAKEHSSVTLLGHALMNRLIAKELKKRGWIAKNSMGAKNWDYGVFHFKLKG